MARKIPLFFCTFTLILYGALTAQVQTPSYPFTKNFISGVIFLKDGTQKAGLIKWFPAQEEKLIFRENEKAPKQKFPPEELAGFQVDSFRFRSLSGFEVYANDFALLGKMSKINHTFGQLLDSGKVNCYMVCYSGYNALGGSVQSYENILFEKKTDSGFMYAAFPVEMRMKEKKFERIKDNLLLFFSDYPKVAEKMKFLRQEDDFTDVLNLVKNID